MILARLGHKTCAGVVALSGDDETNLDVAITTALLRPELPVITRSSSRDVAERMRAFHVREVVNPWTGSATTSASCSGRRRRTS